MWSKPVSIPRYAVISCSCLGKLKSCNGAMDSGMKYMVKLNIQGLRSSGGTCAPPQPQFRVPNGAPQSQSCSAVLDI